MRAFLDRWREVVAERLWPAAFGFVTLALVATFVNDPGVYIGDDRYDQFAAPGRRLAHSLFLWDGSRGLGRVREDLWLGFNVPLAILRSMGLSVWATERVFHALLIALGAIGLVAFLRVFEERIGLGHLLGGLIYGFGPYSAVFLQPSNLYAAYSAVPWLALATYRGVTADRPWRWGAMFALVIFLLGNADPPGVVFASLVVVPILLWTVLLARSASLRSAIGWVVKAGVLTVGVSAAALFKTWVAAATFANRLDTTESPAIINVSSSWTETLRGLGFWLTYYRGEGLARPQSSVFFANSAIILATVAIPVAALAALAAPRVRARVLFAGFVILSAVIMVGNYPINAPNPYGRLLLSAYNAVPTLAAFRTSYKMGAILSLGIAGLVGLGLVEMRGWLARSGRSRVLVSLGAFAVVAVTAVPFWTGHLYDDAQGYKTVPAYWTQAVDYVDSLPGDGRVLLLPGSTRTQYRWGWVGDDIIDAMITRPHAVDTAIALSEPEAADLLHSVSESVAEGTYQAGTIGPILRRLGITTVLIRNDMDWAATRTLRPAQLDALRADPDLHLMRTFGAIGENTTSPTDHTTDGNRERELPPVEVYSVAQPGPVGPRVVPPDEGTVLLSGSGDAWPEMARDGDLTGTGPVVYSGDVSDAALPGVLAHTDRVIVSDTNRREVTTVNGFNLDEGPTLAAGQNQDRPAGNMFSQPDSQTVAWFADASRITATGASRGLQGADPAIRPAAAFDGNASSSWQTFESTNQVGIYLRVDFKRPTVIRDADLTTSGAPAGKERITSAQLLFSNHSQVVVPFAGQSSQVTFAPRTVRWVEIKIAGVSAGTPRPVGFAEISFTGVDLHEWISLPDDLARRAAANPEVAADLAKLPLIFQFQRAQPSGLLPVEPVLRRRFDVPSTRAFTMTATLRTAANATTAIAHTLSRGCGTHTLTIDGNPVHVELTGPASLLRPGDPIGVKSCSPITLHAGWHELQVAGTPVTDLWLKSPGTTTRATTAASSTADAKDAAATPTVKVLGEQPGHFSLLVDAPDGGQLISSQSYENRWIATVDGRPLGAASPLDTLSGWTLPRGRDLRVTLDYRPQQRFGIALFLTAGFVVLCLALVVRRPLASRSRAGVDQASLTSSS